MIGVFTQISEICKFYIINEKNNYMKINFNISFKSFLIFFCFMTQEYSFCWGQNLAVSYNNQKIRKIERKAEDKINKQDYSKATSLYESAYKIKANADYIAELHVKEARLSMALLNYSNVALHYELAMTFSNSVFGLDDICNYLDALRITGQRMKAIDLSRKYSCDPIIGVDPRFLNRVTALQYEEGSLPVGLEEYDLSPMGKTKSGLYSSWIGVKGKEYIYGVSSSKYHDPFRRFYYKMDYYMLSSQSEFSEKNSSFKKRKFLSMIPSSLKNGPIAFSQDEKKLIVTQVVSTNQDNRAKGNKGFSPDFQTRLLYSNYNEKHKKWSSFKPVFPLADGYSYAYPYLFNEGKSLLFSSNMPGGYGGYDIYLTQWNESKQLWENPINLGPLVNSSGDEISPNLYNEDLVFASNGHSGFGGYDVYQIRFSNDKPLLGSLKHYDYPINSNSNEFSLLHVDDNSGFILSDRDTSKGDNVYFFEPDKHLETRVVNKNLYGMSEARAISTGSINLLNSEVASSAPMKVSLPTPATPLIDQEVQEKDMLSLFFDFNSFYLRDDALAKLHIWKNKIDFSKITSCELFGYADEIGSDDYNLYLSGQRAEQVRAWLKTNGVTVPMEVIAKGRVAVKEMPKVQTLSYSSEKGKYDFSQTLQNRIWMMREARRVDVRLIIK